MLKSAGLVGAVVYYDGMHNDARMNLALILTAIKHGAVVTNYTEVTSLQKDTAGKLVGAMIKDTMTGTEFLVRAKGIINATGPFTDAVMALDNPSHKPIVQASSGVHVTFPNYYSPRNMGLLDPATSDGRVIFFLPWQGNTIAGTTDTKARVETDPKPHEEDIRWILEEVRRYLSPDIQVRRGDVLSAWSGLRPLVLNPNAQEGTEGLVRNHLITVSQSGLVTIAGGKWTTYRSMAEETVDRAVELFELNTAWSCRTKEVQLVGSEGWAKNMFIGLIQRVRILVPHRTQEVLMTLPEQYGLETEVAQHLSDNYGDRAWTVCEYMEATGERWPLYGKRLDPAYPCKLSSGILYNPLTCDSTSPTPVLDAEVRYAVHNEYALTVVDFLARRSRLTFLNAQIALDILPKVVEIMAQELRWSAERRRQEIFDTERFMESMGVPLGSRPSQADQEVDNIKWAWSNWVWSWSSPDPLKAAARRVQLSPAQFESGEVELLKAAWASKAGDERKIDRESARDVILEKLGVPGLTESGVDKTIVEVVKDREGVDQEEFLRVRPFFLAIVEWNNQPWYDRCVLRSRTWLLLRHYRKRPADRRGGRSQLRRVAGVYRSSGNWARLMKLSGL